MYPYLVADIGGTNARFAIVTGFDGGQFQFEHISILNGADFASFSAALESYIRPLDIKTTSACVAIAGPISGDVVKMTNLPWEFSRAETARAFGWERFDVLNDFAALAIATSQLNESHLIQVKPGFTEPTGNKAILGPGTGLGVAGLAYSEHKWLPIPSEGGHVNIAPATPLEAEVIKAAMGQHGHVSAEVFISGPGLVNLYKALTEVRGENPKTLEPKDVTQGALDNSDPLCKQTLEMFCSFLGSLSGNIALTYGAKGGVYLAGGILPRFIDFFKSSDFPRRFSEKGVMSHYLENVPVSVISYPHTAFLGAAAWLAQQ